MGYSNWSSTAYREISSGRSGASPREIFTSTGRVDPLMNPRNFEVRESRDSEHHPHSVPLIVGFDVTGSMGHIPTGFAQQHLGTLMSKLVESGWVTDPQVLIAAYGDAVSDQGPLQVGQFESGLEMDMWLTRLWLEGRGGDFPESTTLVHWFAAYRTATDAWEKRRQRGYVFTIGDATTKVLSPSQLKKVFGGDPKEPHETKKVLEDAAERYHCFHVLVSNSGAPNQESLTQWTTLLGDHCLWLQQTDAICDLIGVAVGLTEGNLSPADAKKTLNAAGISPFDADKLVQQICP